MSNATTIDMGQAIDKKGQDMPSTTKKETHQKNNQAGEGKRTIKENLTKIWEQPKLRVPMVAGGLLVAGVATAYFVSGGPNSIQQVQGEQTIAAAAGETDGQVNADQAAYLEEQKRKEALKMQAEGQTNAAVIITPTDQANGSFEGRDGNVNFGAVGAGDDSQSSAINDENSTAKYAHIYFRGRSVHGHPDLSLRKDSSSGELYFWDSQESIRYNIAADGNSLISTATGYSANSSNRGTDGSNYSSNNGTGSNGSNGNAPTIGSDDGSENNAGEQNDTDNQVGSYDATQDPDIKYHNERLAYNFDSYQYNNKSFSEAQSAAQSAALAQADALRQSREAQGREVLSNALDRVRGLQQPSTSYGTKVYGTKNTAEDTQSQIRQEPQPSGSYDNSTNTNGTRSSWNGFSQTNQQDGNQANTPLPSHIIRAGTTYQVVITKTANSDAGNVVEGRIANGPFAGSTVYGVMTPKGRDITVNFTSIQRPNPRLPIIAVRAVATNFKTGKAEVSTSVNRHHVQNYAYAAATSVLKGYGDAYSSQNRAGTTIERTDGTVITSNEGGGTFKEVKANIAQDFSNRLQKDIEHLGERPPTYIIKAGTLLNMRITADWDTRQTANSIPE